MRKIKTASVLGVILLLMVITSPIRAENNQRVVIGGGGGVYDFNKEELNDLTNLLYGSEFFEWYVFDEIGIGIRSHKFYKTDSSDSGEEFIMANVNLAVTWVMFGSTSDLRMAVYAGYGPGGASYKNEAAQIDVTATGNTNSYGLFFDWGGGTWGARLGFHQVFASLDYEDGPITGTIDGSGSSYAFAVRLAF